MSVPLVPPSCDNPPAVSEAPSPGSEQPNSSTVPPQEGEQLVNPIMLPSGGGMSSGCTLPPVCDRRPSCTVPPHGGDTQSYLERFGREPLDFSANTNPLGMSPLAKEAVRAALETADCYPDPYCRKLREDLGAHEGVDPAHIICGNGAADLIVRLAWALRPSRALVTAPSFSEYEEALAQVDCTVEHYLLYAEDGFAIRGDILSSIEPGLDIVFLCEPNNPTGVCTPPYRLGLIARRCRETGTVLVIDECFNGFLENPCEQSMAGLVEHMPNLVVLKAFTKLYGMAGVRLGYALCSNARLIELISGTGQHWPVSSLAQAAGSAALGERQWLEEAKALIGRERTRLAAGLGAAGAKVYLSSANYLLFRMEPAAREGSVAAGEPLPEEDPAVEARSTEESKPADLFHLMAERGVLIRDCSNYEGLGPGYFRIAVRTEEENDRFLHALSDAAKALQHEAAPEEEHEGTHKERRGGPHGGSGAGRAGSADYGRSEAGRDGPAEGAGRETS